MHREGRPREVFTKDLLSKLFSNQEVTETFCPKCSGLGMYPRLEDSKYPDLKVLMWHHCECLQQKPRP